MIKGVFEKNWIYINISLIFVLILSVIILYIKFSNIKIVDNIDQKSQENYSGDVINELQRSVYDNINKISTYVVGITSSKNVKFYMEDPSLLQGPGTAIEKNAQLDEASGILLGKKGYVLTNKHVVENTDAKYSIVLQDGSIYDVSSVRYDKGLDLAILKTSISDKDIKNKNISIPMFYDFYDDVFVGKFVLAMGKKGSDDIVLGFGILSSKNKEIMINNENLYVNLYQIDTLLQPGFSGGPLFDLNGKILAMNTAVDQTDGQSFSLPISNQLLDSTLGSIEKYGKIIRGLVGIKYDEISGNKELQKKYNLTGGIVLKDVLVDLPAFVAGLQINDIVLSINDTFITKDNPFLFQIYNYLPGEKLKFGVIRQNSFIEISVVLGENL